MSPPPPASDRDVEPDEPGTGTGGAPVKMFTLLQGVALIVATAVLTCGLTLWLSDGGSDSYNDVDVGFLADMTTHHQGAIGLSFDYLAPDNDDVVAHFAQEIVQEQTVEISTMNQQLAEADRDDDPILTDAVAMEWMGEAVAPNEMPGMPTEAELEELRAARGLDADDLFSRLMIAHHAAGVAMADYEAEHGESPTVRRFAENVARVQRTEIIEINNRRAKLGLERIEPDFDIHGSGGHTGDDADH